MVLHLVIWLAKTLAYCAPLLAAAAAACVIVFTWRAAAGRVAVVGRRPREYVVPIEAAAATLLKTRPGVVRMVMDAGLLTEDTSARGRLTLPLSWVGTDTERDSLLTLVRSRLGTDLVAARFKLAGHAPHMQLYVPPQPPPFVSWERFLELADPISPYLGDAAGGRAVRWDLGDDSPHMGIIGGSGVGKSELMAAVTAQFMRAGAGVIVLDPKATSHRWLMDIDGVLYCGERRMLFDTVMWLDDVMNDRIAQNLRVADDIDFPRIVILLEERNSLQDKLRDAWAEIRVSGQPQMSPAIKALDRLSSMGRSININVILGGQETAQQVIGRRSNYGAFSVGGRTAEGHWRNIGVKKPAISSSPGRFGYVVAGQVQVFQAPYMDLKQERARLVAWATGGEPLLDVRAMMSSHDAGVPFPSSEPVDTTTGGSGDLWLVEQAGDRVTLPQWAASCGLNVATVRQWSTRYPEFPAAVGTLGRSRAFSREALDAWREEHRSASA